MYKSTNSRGSTTNNQDSKDDEMDMKKLLKDIERLGSSTMAWKERKKLENKNVVALGGKPTKSHRMPLSVAKGVMKNRKRREQKKIDEEKLLGIFTRHRSESSQAEKRRPEDRVLKATEGHFSHGVLNVKHLLNHRPVAKVAEGAAKLKKGKSKGKKKGKKGKRGKRR
ncbi:hypothetical protein AXF42_Ash010901 [Apostasia shenzhenica]|uniref:Uncharacterized protein n=1 Tax=Apostasia shenzhenica TaxID=1088818 RepID=A0A2I0A114_9ASPA|nr:hypothetical protein AXF42_Ash010901 [Apostasia shenzhenica]